MAEGLIIVGIGFGAIAFGWLAESFHAAFLRKPRPEEKALPRWVGRTIFTIIGLWLIHQGYSHLRGQQPIHRAGD